MSPYIYEADAMNGYVTFDENVKLRFIFEDGSEALSKYNLYDTVKVIGIVSNLEKTDDDQYTIILTKSKLVENTLYKDFDLVVEPNNDCTFEKKLLYSTKDVKYYQTCINSFDIKYSVEDIYSLEYILQDNKMDLKDIYKKANKTESFDDGGSKLYQFDNFNILACNTTSGSKDVYFGNKSLNYSKDLCPNEMEIKNEE